MKKDVDEEDNNHNNGEVELEEDEDEAHEEFSESFFESFDRVPSGVSFDVDLLSSASASDSDSDSDDVRFSFASAVAPPSFRRLSLEDFPDIKDHFDEDDDRGADHHHHHNLEDDGDGGHSGFDYNIWMAGPMSIKERRRKLLQGMGLASSKHMPLPQIAAKSRKFPPKIPKIPSKSRLCSSRFAPRLVPPTLVRSRSDTELSLPYPAAFAGLFRVSSAPPSWCRRWAEKKTTKAAAAAFSARGCENTGGSSPEEVGVVKIKNLDTGKEFVVSADGALDKLNDPQTGHQFTMDEFEKFLGFSPIVKEVMRRVTDASTAAIVTATGNGILKSKSRNCKTSKKKVNWLKNIKFVASTVTGLMEKEREAVNDKSNSTERLKVHQHGKSCKELTGLYMCQDIQAHQGSIWTMKFSCDSRYLASAGEDRIVQIWQVVECDTMASSLQSSGKKPLLANGGPSLSLSTRSGGLSNQLGGQPSKRTKKGKGIPDYIAMPETIFTLSAEPFCSFEGHLDDVLDLSWSKSQYLLSSSMDKTVRLWDIETKACLKLFAHNDYVTCIQFNPADERYFISGSLDAKVRIWSIPDRQVFDWSDLHEMVTAACYTPDGQGALVGSHKGSCRFYNTSDAKLCQEGQIDIRAKKKKSSAKKITGFQFAPDNPSEVLITSADSQIRVFDGVDMIHKFRGFKNVSSQISASCTMNGKYVVCASEDSHVYIWKRSRASTAGKHKPTTRSHEHFYCKDVSVAIPWPNGSTNCEPSPDLPSWSKRHNDMRTPSNLEDMFPSSRSHNLENPASCHEDVNSPTRSGAAIGSSSSSLGSASLRSGHGSAVSSSSSSFSSWGWGAGNSNRATGSIEEANAWGLVVVTGGLGGSIRVYQNFGLPLRLSRQPNLF